MLLHTVITQCNNDEMQNLPDPEQMKLYRKFLRYTQAQFASALGTTQTSVARWESGVVPISLMTMSHLRALVTAKIMEETRKLFAILIPQLTLSEFTGLFSTPDNRFTDDANGRLYLGSVYIEGYRRHTLHIGADDHEWYALDRDSKPTPVDSAFIAEVIAAGNSLLANK